MNSSGEENSRIERLDKEETNSNNEGRETSTTSRPKKYSRYVQNENPQSWILGDLEAEA